MVLFELCASILIINIQSENIYCSSDECRGTSINCAPNENCKIDCYGADSCTDTIIHCPKEECTVFCYGDRACEGGIINASLSAHLWVESEGYQSGPSEIYCSEQYEFGKVGKESCIIKGISNNYPQYNNLELYVYAGIDDIEIECANLLCIENSTLFCGSDFRTCNIGDALVLPSYTSTFVSTSDETNTNTSKSNAPSTSNLDVPAPSSSNKDKIESIMYTMIGIVSTLILIALIYFIKQYQNKSKKLEETQENLPQKDPEGDHDSANDDSHSHSNSAQQINIQVPGFNNMQINGNLDLHHKEGDHPQTFLDPTKSTFSHGNVEGNIVITKPIILKHATLSTDSMYDAHSPTMDSKDRKTDNGTTKGQSRGINIDLSVNDIKQQRSMESTQVLNEALTEVLKLPSNHSKDVFKENDDETNGTQDVYNEKNGDV